MGHKADEHLSLFFAYDRVEAYQRAYVQEKGRRKKYAVSPHLVFHSMVAPGKGNTLT